MQATVERIADEQQAQNLAITADKARLDSRKDVRNLNERLKMARSLKLKGQIILLESAITQRHRKWAIEHANKYPEVTKQQAMDAMCEPINYDEEARKRSGLSNDQFDALRYALSDSLFAQSMNKRQMSNIQRAFDAYMRPGSTLEVPMQMSAYQQLIGSRPMYDRTTHKYDLACEPLRVEDKDNVVRSMLGQLGYEGKAETAVMLPMAALCELAEAKNKDLFDSFEVWRPSEWKAPDPWLVGAYIERNDRMEAVGQVRYFKLCDWR